MDIDGLIGSARIRAATLAALLLSATGWALQDDVAATGARQALFILTSAAGVLAFVGLVHSFRVLYAWWLRVAERVHRLVVTVLFGACYLLIVPWFFLIMRVVGLLRLRSRTEESLWVDRSTARCDDRSLSRMG